MPNESRLRVAAAFRFHGVSEHLFQRMQETCQPTPCTKETDTLFIKACCSGMRFMQDEGSGIIYANPIETASPGFLD